MSGEKNRPPIKIYLDEDGLSTTVMVADLAHNGEEPVELMLSKTVSVKTRENNKVTEEDIAEIVKKYHEVRERLKEQLARAREYIEQLVEKYDVVLDSLELIKALARNVITEDCSVDVFWVDETDC